MRDALRVTRYAFGETAAPLEVNGARNSAQCPRNGAFQVWKRTSWNSTVQRMVGRVGFDRTAPFRRRIMSPLPSSWRLRAL